jgi:ribosomal protein L24
VPTYKFNDRVVVTSGKHQGKHGKVIMQTGKTVSVRFDGDHGSYYVGVDSIEREK